MAQQSSPAVKKRKLSEATTEDCCPKRELSAITDVILSDPTSINVDVGSPAQRFPITKALACAQSPFFRKTLKGHWKESSTGIVPLPDDSPDTFAIWRTWLYTNRLEVPGENVLSRFKRGSENTSQARNVRCTTEEDAALREVYSSLARAYVMGDKLQDTAFQDAAVDEIIYYTEKTHAYPSSPTAYIYANTIECAPLRRLIIDFFACRFCIHWYKQEIGSRNERIEALPKEFLIDTMCELSKMRDMARTQALKRSSWVTDPCLYHQHTRR